MEEADAILLLTLRQIECNIPEEVTTVAGITSTLLVPIVSRCLTLITGETNFPTTLPSSVARCHRVCAQLGAKLKELGFARECGYSTFLYPSVQDTRTMLLWLVEKLPKTSGADDVEEALGSNALFNRSIVEQLTAWTKEPWAIHACQRHCSSGLVTQRYSRSHLGTTPVQVPTLDLSEHERKYFAEAAAYVTEQPPRDDMPPSVLETNMADVVEHEEREKELDEAGADDLAAYRTQKRAGLQAQIRQAFATAQEAAADGDLAGALAGGRFGATGVGELANLADILDALQLAGAGDKDQGSRFQHQTDFAQEQAGAAAVVNVGAASGDVASEEKEEKEEEGEEVDREEEERKKRQAELEALEKELADILAAIDANVNAKGSYTSGIRQHEASLGQALAETDKLERAYMVKKKSIEMLPDAANNLLKLQGICGKTAQRLMTLAAEWEQHRKPLVDAQRALKEGLGLRKERCKKMVIDMKAKRGDMQQMGVAIREREERYRALAEEYDKMPKNVNRSLYTYRIMDIIKQVSKQKAEIAKIIRDIHDVQKDINAASSKLHRKETEADERIYQGASDEGADEAHKSAYASLVSLRQFFEELVNAVSERGKADNVARDLEARSEQLASRNTANNMERIQRDLQQVKAENDAMAARLR